MPLIDTKYSAVDAAVQAACEPSHKLTIHSAKFLSVVIAERPTIDATLYRSIQSAV